MKLKLVILLVAYFYCTVNHVRCTELLAAKAAKGAKVLGGVLAVKGELLKGAASLLNKKPCAISHSPSMKPGHGYVQHKPVQENNLNVGAHPLLALQPSISVLSPEDQKPFAELDPPVPVLELNSDMMLPGSSSPLFKLPFFKHHSPSVKPCSTHPSTHPLQTKFQKILGKMTGISKLLSSVIQKKKHAVAKFVESMEPREQSVVYQMVPPSEYFPMPVEEITFEK